MNYRNDSAGFRNHIEKLFNQSLHTFRFNDNVFHAEVALLIFLLFLALICTLAMGGGGIFSLGVKCCPMPEDGSVSNLMDFLDGVLPDLSSSPISIGIGAGRFLDRGLKTIGL